MAALASEAIQTKIYLVTQSGHDEITPFMGTAVIGLYVSVHAPCARSGGNLLLLYVISVILYPMASKLSRVHSA